LRLQEGTHLQDADIDSARMSRPMNLSLFVTDNHDQRGELLSSSPPLSAPEAKKPASLAGFLHSYARHLLPRLLFSFPLTDSFFALAIACCFLKFQIAS
jgi:hypothetical protein